MTVTGHVQTVLGALSPEHVGVTLPHEHLLVDLVTPYFSEPSDLARREMARAPFTVDLRDKMIADCTLNLDNLRLDDQNMIAAELSPFVDHGGNTIVELTSVDIGRNPTGLCSIARQTGLNIVMGSGYYIDRSHPLSVRRRGEDDLAAEIIHDLREGPDGTGPRAGIIGEIGVDALSGEERKVLRAAACAQRQTGASINVHVEFIMGGRDAGLWACNALEDAGADLTRVIFSHQDSSHEDPDYQRQLLGKGIVLEYDGFGYEMQTDAYGGLKYPTDDERIAAISSLVASGWERQLLISTDICMKFLLRRFGGHGYGHILESVVPRMRSAGISDGALTAMLVETPRRLLTIPANPQGSQCQRPR